MSRFAIIHSLTFESLLYYSRTEKMAPIIAHTFGLIIHLMKNFIIIDCIITVKVIVLFIGRSIG